jgi:hypothetical protein
MRIMEEDKAKTIFLIEWGSFSYIIIPFSLKNASVVFSKIVVVAFKDFMHMFL